jgi:hypothetical protein
MRSMAIFSILMEYKTAVCGKYSLSEITTAIALLFYHWFVLLYWKFATN